MQFREVVALQTLCLKAISKKPVISEESLCRALSFAPRETTRDIRQRLLQVLIEAGRCVRV